MNAIKQVSITHVVLSGGAMLGLAYCGVLEALRIKARYKNVHTVAGTSIGAFFACLWALDVTLEQMKAILCETFRNDEHTRFPIIQIEELFKGNLGMDDGDRLISSIRMLAPYVSDLKFSDLHPTKSLVVCATRIPSMIPFYFSRETTPNVKVLDAVKASMSLPILFKPVFIDGYMYIDGSITDHIPLASFTGVNKDAIAIFHVIQGRRRNKIDTSDMDVDLRLIPYIEKLVDIMAYNLFSYKELGDLYKHYVRLDACPVDFMPIELVQDGINIHVTKKNIDECFMYGFNRS